MDPRYLEQLDLLRGIESYRIDRGRNQPENAILVLRTQAGERRLVIGEYRSHLTHQLVDQLVANRNRQQDLLILAPHIGKQLAAKLEEGGIHYLDRNGNCHIELEPLFIHVEGRRNSPSRGANKGLRSAGYQVLFAYLARPSLLNETIRSVAAIAGVSTQPVHDMKHRLLEEELVVKTRSSLEWVPRRRQDALNLWLHGYQTTVRPSLLWGTFRAREEPDELEARLATVLPAASVDFRWGGTSAGFRLTGHYRGARTTVHVHSFPTDLKRKLGVVADPTGNLVLMNAFGEINWHSERETVHPLLVYSEMLNEGSERAREAAQEVFDKLILPQWDE